MTRMQYPLRPAYAATINGCQGATLHKCVLDLRHAPFMHGHLYVALSRVRSRADLALLVDEDHESITGVPLGKNIVWPELLLQHNAKRSKAISLFCTVHADSPLIK